ncbi:MAG: NosD domain-containing protein [bacterium]
MRGILTITLSGGLLLVLINSCSQSPNGAKTGSISGQVLLENQSTHGGVTVALYETASLDSLTDALTRQYLNSSFLLSQPAIFDHRQANSISETTTSADGSFKLEKIPEGEYNVVAEKDGFGWKYVYNVDLNVGSKSLAPLTLKETREVQGTIAANETWESDRHYLVTGDITIPTGVSLTIQENTVIRFDGIYKMEVQGDLNLTGTSDGLVWFTSANQTPSQGDWKGLLIDNQKRSTQVVNNCRIDYANTAIDISNSDLLVDNTSVKKNNLGISVFESDVTLQNSLIYKCDRGMLQQGNSNINILKNIFSTISENDIINSSSNNEISDNVFMGGKVCLFYRQLPSLSIRIHHNLFREYETVLSLESSKEFVLFNNNTVRKCTSEGVFAISNSYPNLASNNFVDNDMHVVTKGGRSKHDEPLQTADIQAVNCWWGTINESDIRAKIRDGNTDGTESELGQVIIIPKQESEIPTAFPRK